MSDWRPTASIENIKARAGLLATIRQFFAEKNVMEVETPLLAPSTGTDIHIQSWKTANKWTDGELPLYLQTSPEFAMKRLLCSGSGPIYQICKSFRFEESTKQHSPEFTMLEWYRPGYSLMELMDEVESLVRLVVSDGTIERYSYKEVFQQYLGLDPHQISLEALQEIAHQHIDLSAQDLSRTDYLQLLLAQVIEPKLRGNWFLYNYPVEQAALAQVAKDEQGIEVAQRFELFCSSMEIANGYFELTDAIEQKKRFMSDLQIRDTKNLERYPMDEKLIEALECGLPPCAGVALGVDRLLMLKSDAKHINDVLTFPV